MEAVLAELCVHLERCGRLKDQLSFYNAVMSREWLSSTAMPPGWAVPHARIPGLPRLAFALGRSSTPLAWPDSNGLGVSLVFVFAVPEDDAATYMRLLAALARLSQNPAQCRALLEAPDGRSLFELLQQVPLPQPVSHTRPDRAQPGAPLSCSTP